MSDSVTIIRQRQLAIRREIDRRGIALKAIAFDSGVSYETLLTYFPAEGSREPAQIPGGVVFALCDGAALPPDLLSLLVPDGWQIVRAPEGLDHDALCELARDYVDTKMKAHRADSLGGVAIVDAEKTELDRKVIALTARAA